MSLAVPGINCIRPIAPLGERALGLNPDSAWITARISAGSMPFALAAMLIVVVYSCVNRRVALQSILEFGLQA